MSVAAYLNFSIKEHYNSEKNQFQDTISEQKSYILGLEQIIKRENNKIERNTDSLEIKNAINMGIIINRAIIEKSRDKCICNCK